MQRLSTITAGLLVLGFTLLIPQTAYSQSYCGMNNGQTNFSRFDRNNDGRLSQNERRRALRMIQRNVDRYRYRQANPYSLANIPGGWHWALLNGQNVAQQAGGWHGALLNGQNVAQQAGGWHGALLNGQSIAQQITGLPVNFVNGQNIAGIDVDGDGQINQHELMYAQLLNQQARRKR